MLGIPSVGGFLYMSKKKSTTTQNQSYNNAVSYGQVKPEDTADVQAFRDWRPEIDPNIPYRASAAHGRLSSSLNNPIGGYYSANTRDAIQRAGDRSIDQDASQQYRSSQYDANNQRSGQLGSLAALTAPRILSTGSSGTGSGTSTQIQSGDLLGQLIGAGSQVGSAALL